MVSSTTRILSKLPGNLQSRLSFFSRIHFYPMIFAGMPEKLQQQVPPDNHEDIVRAGLPKFSLIRRRVVKKLFPGKWIAGSITW